MFGPTIFAMEDVVARRALDQRGFYRMLEAYYLNNGLYEVTRPELFAGGMTTRGNKGLRNPANRSVEFHVTHTWPGSLQKSLPLLAANPNLAQPLQQVWAWSNWAVKKQLAVRWFAMFGDWFCKVATSSAANGAVQRVYLQNIKPEWVSDFETDERGNITMIRLDMPLEKANATLTEVWSRQSGYALYRHTRPAGSEINTLGRPLESKPLRDFGIDFVPFVHAPFIDIGQKRGMGVFTHALDKIDEVNRMASRLHQLIFRYNRPTMAVLANGLDANGRPLPPPRIGPGLTALREQEPLEDEVLTLPGTSKLEYLVPALNYAAHLEAIAAMSSELEEDLPELSYYRQKELGSNLSGKAVRLMLSQAVNRTTEARGNLESALVKADKMALTIGANAGLFGDIGSYSAGDLDHTFAEREVIPFSAEENAATLASEVGAGVPLTLAAKRRGWQAQELEELQNALRVPQEGILRGGNDGRQ